MVANRTDTKSTETRTDVAKRGRQRQSSGWQAPWRSRCWQPVN